MSAVQFYGQCYRVAFDLPRSERARQQQLQRGSVAVFSRGAGGCATVHRRLDVYCQHTAARYCERLHVRAERSQRSDGHHHHLAAQPLSVPPRLLHFVTQPVAADIHEQSVIHDRHHFDGAVHPIFTARGLHRVAGASVAAADDRRDGAIRRALRGEGQRFARCGWAECRNRVRRVVVDGAGWIIGAVSFVSLRTPCCGVDGLWPFRVAVCVLERLQHRSNYRRE